MVNAGQVRPLVSRSYPLQQIARAQADFQSKTLPGKLVLVPPGVDSGDIETGGENG